jgi:hypothetical protein
MWDFLLHQKTFHDDADIENDRSENEKWAGLFDFKAF